MRANRVERNDRNGSVLDLFFLFLFLFVILGTILRWQNLRMSGGSGELSSYRLVGIMEGVDPLVGDCMEEGESVYTTDGEKWGTLIFAERIPTPIVLTANGASYQGEWEETVRCDLLVHLEFLGNERDGTIFQNGTHVLSVGQPLLLYSERSALHFNVLKLEQMPYKMED
ncbi:MAG: hypothetical protein IKA05_08780 [Clostridia bacterium]|nr:hypothetical protein [Clostridia bacterium]